MSVVVTIADAVVAVLNAGGFDLPFTAERAYTPGYTLEQLATLRVSVVPRGWTIAGRSRQEDQFTYTIDVAVQQRVDGSNAEVDGLMALVEALADRFRRQRLPNLPEARCVGVSSDPIYAAEHLLESRVFTAVLTLSFQTARG
jgi:hypothetical protein